MNEERYEITSLLGKGQTGGVYRATDHELDREVAIRRFYSDSSGADPSKHEAQLKGVALALSEIKHRSLVPVLRAGVDEDGAYLISHFVEGSHLSVAARVSPFDEPTAYSMALQLLDALALAHAAGFIHGVLTPSSVLVHEQSPGCFQFVITDLGLPSLASLVHPKFSGTGSISDPLLVAPELFNGHPATEQSDCYMLGQLIYLSLIGGHPFAGKDYEQLKHLHKSGQLPPLSRFRNDISPEFESWLRVMTHPKPRKRFQSATLALLALAEISATSQPAITPSEPRLKKASGALFTVGVLLTLCTLTTYAIFSKAAQRQAPVENPVVAVKKDLQIPPLEKKDFAPEAEPPRVNIGEITEKILHTTVAENSHPRTAADVSDQRNLDWAVFTGPNPSADNHSRADTHIIGEIRPIGKLRATRAPVSNLLFYNDSGDVFRPTLCAVCEQLGDGWNVSLEHLSSTPGPRSITVHFTTWNCDALLQFKQTAATDVLGQFQYNGEALSTSYAVRYTFPDGSFEGLDSIDLCLVSTKQKEDKDFGISLSAVIVE